MSGAGAGVGIATVFSGLEDGLSGVAALTNNDEDELLDRIISGSIFTPMPDQVDPAEDAASALVDLMASVPSKPISRTAKAVNPLAMRGVDLAKLSSYPVRTKAFRSVIDAMNGFDSKLCDFLNRKYALYFRHCIDESNETPGHVCLKIRFRGRDEKGDEIYFNKLGGRDYVAAFIVCGLIGVITKASMNGRFKISGACLQTAQSFIARHLKDVEPYTLQASFDEVVDKHLSLFSESQQAKLVPLHGKSGVFDWHEVDKGASAADAHVLKKRKKRKKPRGRAVALPPALPPPPVPPIIAVSAPFAGAHSAAACPVEGAETVRGPGSPPTV